MKRMNRREFIKYAAGLPGGVLLGTYAWFPFTLRNEKEIKQGVEKKDKARVADGLGTQANSRNKFTLVIDAGACIGCRTCQWGCKEENNIPDVIAPPWIEIFELNAKEGFMGHASIEELKEGATTAYTRSPSEGKWYLAVQCQHCDNPPCVRVCPVGATYKDRDGFVLMDYDRCIGCRICVVACPYSARRFNWLPGTLPPDKVNPLVPVRYLGVVEKCTFCVHRVRRGELPRCVEVCPVRARHFGDLNDLQSEVSTLLRAEMGSQLLAELNTKPSLWYIKRGKKWLP